MCGDLKDEETNMTGSLLMSGTAKLAPEAKGKISNTGAVFI